MAKQCISILSLNMPNLEFRLIEETRNYLSREINHNDLISE